LGLGLKFKFNLRLRLRLELRLRFKFAISFLVRMASQRGSLGLVVIIKTVAALKCQYLTFDVNVEAEVAVEVAVEAEVEVGAEVEFQFAVDVEVAVGVEGALTLRLDEVEDDDEVQHSIEFYVLSLLLKLAATHADVERSGR
jgi:hypothetical protein